MKERKIDPLGNGLAYLQLAARPGGAMTADLVDATGVTREGVIQTMRRLEGMGHIRIFKGSKQNSPLRYEYIVGSLALG